MNTPINLIKKKTHKKPAAQCSVHSNKGLVMCILVSIISTIILRCL